MSKITELLFVQLLDNCNNIPDLRKAKADIIDMKADLERQYLKVFDKQRKIFMCGVGVGFVLLFLFRSYLHF